MQYVDSFSSAFGVPTRTLWFNVEGYTATEFVTALLKLQAIPLATVVEQPMQPVAVPNLCPPPAVAAAAAQSLGLERRPQQTRHQEAAPTGVAPFVTLDSAFATASRAKTLEAEGNLEAAAAAYEQVWIPYFLVLQ